ncbi:arsenate reductase [Saprospiraceae bacterium]|jgi:arsenate reductase|nr:arsenate reductase [Saprospiraceae bacterium]
MKKIYHLASCSTCQRIIKELGGLEDFEKQNIKEEKITPEQLEEMKEKSGSYESLFSRRAMKYKAWDLKNKDLSEKDYKNYILEEYTFLKRPVFLIGEEIFVGNTKKVVEAVAKALSNG